MKTLNEEMNKSLEKMMHSSRWFVVEIDTSEHGNSAEYIAELASEIEKEGYFRLSRSFNNHENKALYHLHFVRKDRSNIN